MKHRITALLLIMFIAISLGCTKISPVASLEDTNGSKSKIPSGDALELLTQTDCYFMGIKVITILPGKLKAEFEDERGIYFYSHNFKNATNSYYKKAGIFIPTNETLEPYAFAEKSSPNSLAVLSCDSLNFAKTDDQSKPFIR